MAKMIELYAVHSFSTSTNLCQCTAMQNADASNCCITLSCSKSSDNVIKHTMN